MYLGEAGELPYMFSSKRCSWAMHMATTPEPDWEEGGG